MRRMAMPLASRCGFALPAVLAVSAIVACSAVPEPFASSVPQRSAADRPTALAEPHGHSSTQSDSAARIAAYRRCWATWNDAWDELAPCYEESIVSEEPGSGSPPWRGIKAVMGHVALFKQVFPDARGEPRLILLNGNRIASVARVTGTHSGAMRQAGGEIPPTGKRIALDLAHLEELAVSGKAETELIFLDHATLWGQLGLYPGPHRAITQPATETASEPQVIVAKNDAGERDNLRAYRDRLASFNARDAERFASSLATEVVWSDLTFPDDLDKAGAIAWARSQWQGFSDLKLDASTAWAAGDYVVALGSMAGSQDGDLASWGVAKTGKHVSLPFLEISQWRKGQMVASRIFYDGLGLAAQLGLTN